MRPLGNDFGLFAAIGAVLRQSSEAAGATLKRHAVSDPSSITS
jgi:hypothetical protein